MADRRPCRTDPLDRQAPVATIPPPGPPPPPPPRPPRRTSDMHPAMLKPPELAGLAEWEPLAQGGFSMVWKARQRSLDRAVAVKVRLRSLENDGDRHRFLREAGAAGRLSGHPGIVSVY